MQNKYDMKKTRINAFTKSYFHKKNNDNVFFFFIILLYHIFSSNKESEHINI